MRAGRGCFGAAQHPLERPDHAVRVVERFDEPSPRRRLRAPNEGIQALARPPEFAQQPVDQRPGPRVHEPQLARFEALSSGGSVSPGRPAPGPARRSAKSRWRQELLHLLDRPLCFLKRQVLEAADLPPDLASYPRQPRFPRRSRGKRRGACANLLAHHSPQRLEPLHLPGCDPRLAHPNSAFFAIQSTPRNMAAPHAPNAFTGATAQSSRRNPPAALPTVSKSGGSGLKGFISLRRLFHFWEPPSPASGKTPDSAPPSRPAHFANPAFLRAEVGKTSWNALATHWTRRKRVYGPFWSDTWRSKKRPCGTRSKTSARGGPPRTLFGSSSACKLASGSRPRPWCGRSWRAGACWRRRRLEPRQPGIVIPSRHAVVLDPLIQPRRLHRRALPQLLDAHRDLYRSFRLLDPRDLRVDQLPILQRLREFRTHREGLLCARFALRLRAFA